MNAELRCQTAELIIGQCQYDKVTSVKADCQYILRQYAELEPILLQGLLQLQGNIDILYQKQYFKVYIMMRWLKNFPQSAPLVFLKNINMNTFSVNPVYQPGIVQNGELIFFNRYLTYKEGLPSLQLLISIQQQLAIQFPFFSKTNQYQSQNLWGSQNQLPPGSQIQIIPQTQLQQSQILNTQTHKQQSDNWINQSMVVVPHSNQSQIQQLKVQEPKEPSSQVMDLTSSVFSTIKDIWKKGATLLETQQEKEIRYTAQLSDKSNLHRQQISQNIQNAILELRAQTDNLENLYEKQVKYTAEIYQEDQKVCYLISESDELNKYIDYQIVLLSTKPDLNMLDNMDQLSKQLLNIIADLHSYRDGLLYLFNDFKDGELAYETLMKYTRQIAQQCFDGTILIRKCRDVL